MWAYLYDACIVYQYVQPAVVTDHAFYQVVYLVGVGYVGGKGRYIGAVALQIYAGLFQLIGVACADGESGALSRKQAAQRKTESAGAAGNEHHFAGKIDLVLLAHPAAYGICRCSAQGRQTEVPYSG